MRWNSTGMKRNEQKWYGNTGMTPKFQLAAQCLPSQSQVFVPIQNNLELYLQHNNSTLGRIRKAVKKVTFKFKNLQCITDVIVCKTRITASSVKSNENCLYCLKYAFIDLKQNSQEFNSGL